jgi:ribonucleoside-diphosphate reductase alpha chain
MSYLSFDDRLELGLANLEDMPAEQTSLVDDIPGVVVEEKIIEPVVAQNVSSAPKAEKKAPTNDEHAPLCYNCGNQTQRSGSCYVCTSCGSTTGCS